MRTEAAVTRADIARGFREVGLPRGAVLLLHSSLKRFGRVEGGAGAVVDGVLDALGPEGTLLAPTLTGGPALSAENPPHVDLRTEPGWTGAVSEALRTRPGALRSTHPTHSCAAHGAEAEAITRGHEVSPTPCGYTSPYQRLIRRGGFIALAGCGLDVCTTFHAIESLACVEYHLQKRIAFGSCIDMNGNRVETPCRLHDYGSPAREFAVMEPILVKKGLLQTGRAGAALLRLVDAAALAEVTLDRLRFDPWYLTVNRGRRDLSPWG